MSALPAPQPNQAFCLVSALEAGCVQLQLDQFITGAEEGQYIVPPSLAFLLRRSSDPSQTFVFDLGIRKDLSAYPPRVHTMIAERFPTIVEEDVADSLRKGGLDPSDIDTVCLSHLHFDHVGDTTLFPNATFVVGADAKKLITPGYPEDPKSQYASNLLPEATKFVENWPCAIGPFTRAMDFYGDGSLYVINAEGHCPGHINVLVRTSGDGGWVYLAGDSAHHWSLVTGEREIVVHPKYGCLHDDKENSTLHLERIRKLLGMDRVRVILAHDDPWYKINKGGEQFWPGVIPSL